MHSEAFLHSLMRKQLRLSIFCAAAFLLVLLGLPLANYFLPEFMATRILGFTLTWLTNQSIVEASANLVNWQPIWTNILPGASADFVDPEWVNHPRRFYRARSD